MKNTGLKQWLSKLSRARNKEDAALSEGTNHFSDDNRPFVTRTEKRFRAIYEYAPIMIDAFLEDGRCVLWNRECEKQLGFSREEMLKSKDPLFLVYPDKKTRDDVLKTIIKRDGIFREFSVTAKDGTIRHQMWANYGLPDKTIIAIGYDVTQRKHSEERLAKINECFLSFGPNPLENINRLTGLCGELLKGDGAIYNRLEGENLNSLGRWHLPADYRPIDKAEGHICYDVIKEGGAEFSIINDLPGTKYFKTDPWVAPYHLKTYVGKTVQFGGQRVGALCVVYTKDFVPSQEDKQILRLIAAAVGIEEKRREVEMSLKRRVAFEALLGNIAYNFTNLASDSINWGIEETLEMIGKFVGAQRSYIFLVSEDQTQADLVYEWIAKDVAPRSERIQKLLAKDFPWATQKLKRKEVIEISKEEDLPLEAEGLKRLLRKQNVQAMICAPLILEGRLFGFLGFDSVGAPREWDQEVRDLLKIVGEILTSTLERKNTEELLREREVKFEKQKTALLELAKHEILEEEDFDVTLRDITEIAAQATDLARVGIWAYDEEKKLIHCLDLFEKSKRCHVKGERLFEKDAPLYFKAMKEDRTIVAHDTISHPHTQELLASYIRPQGISSMLDAPIRLEGKTIGVVCLEHCGPPRHWTNEEQSFAASLSDAVSLTIEQRRKRRADEALRSSQATLKEVLDLSPNFIFAKDIEGRFIIVNEAVAEAYGTTVEDLIGKADGDFNKNEEEVRAFRKDDLEVLRTGKSKFIPEERITDASGRVRYLQTTKIPFKIPGTDRPAILGVSVDISLRKEAEEALRQSTQRFKDIAENASEWIWEVDLQGRYTFSSNVVERILGYTAEEMLNKYFYDFFHPDYRDELKNKAFEAFTRKESFTEFINPNLHKNGETVWVMTSGVPILDDKGNLIGYRGADVDITQRKKDREELEEHKKHLELLVEERTRELRQSERLAATGRLAASIAHEINNPLQGIMTHLEIIKENLPEDFSKQKNYDFVKANLEKISGIVRKLLETYRMPEANKEEVFIHDLVEKVIAFLEPQLRDKKITVKLNFAKDLPVVRGWPQQLHQVLLNLILNARDSIKKKGEIIITTKHTNNCIKIGSRIQAGGSNPATLSTFSIRSSPQNRNPGRG